jgi:hypothetical protein
MGRFPRIFERGSGSGPAESSIGDDFYPWGKLIRALASHDPTRYIAMARCSLPEALLAYQERLKQEAKHQYEVDVMVWAVLVVGGAKNKMPELPEILKD